MARTQRVRLVIGSLCLALVCLAPLVDVLSADARAARRGLVRGVVRLEGRAVRDDDGVFNPLGATLFWLAWGYKFDRARLEANLRALSDAGVDYVRALGDVGPGNGWQDREIDPGWSDYESVITGATDLAYDRYGLRVQWTIFGGVDHLGTADARAALVSRFADMARGRAHKIFVLEIANESWQNGFDGPAGQAELRSLGQRLAGATDVLVALSAPPGGPTAVCDLYAGSGVDIVTMHYDRDRAGPAGPWGPVAEPARQAASASGRQSTPGSRCSRPLPAATLNNEPVGPGSSNDEERDPLRLAPSYVTTFVAGNAAYVLHTGPGVRGGGAADRERGRAADVMALPEFDSIRRALVAAKQYTPPGLANWKPLSGAQAGPLQGIDDAVARGDLANGVLVAHGPQIFGVLLGLRRDIQLRATTPLVIEVLDPTSGAVLSRATLGAGQTIDIRARPGEGGDGLVVRARLRVAATD